MSADWPFVNAHERAAKLYSDSKTWTRMSVANVAASGRFSSDRTIIDYNRDIWQTDATASCPLRMIPTWR